MCKLRYNWLELFPIILWLFDYLEHGKCSFYTLLWLLAVSSESADFFSLPFLQQIFIVWLLCVSHCASWWLYSKKEDSLVPAFILTVYCCFSLKTQHSSRLLNAFMRKSIDYHFNLSLPMYHICKIDRENITLELTL